MEKPYGYKYTANLVVNEAYNLDKVLNIYCNNDN